MPSFPSISPGRRYGPIVVGGFIGAILYGVIVVQTALYSRSSKKDSRWLRWLIIYLFIVSTVQTILDVVGSFRTLGLDPQTNALDPPSVMRPGGILSAAIATPVQSFMAWRIRILTHSNAWACLIAIGSFASFISGSLVSVFLCIASDVQEFERYRPITGVWLATSTATDAIITVLLAWTLYKNKTGTTWIDNHITKVIVLTVQSGALTCVAAAAAGIIFFSIPNSTIFFVWSLPLPRFYVITVLSSLSARESFHGSRGSGPVFNPTGVGRPVSPVVFADARSRATSQLEVGRMDIELVQMLHLHPISEDEKIRV